MNSDLRSATSTGPASRAQAYVSQRNRRRVVRALVLAALLFGTLGVILTYRARIHRPTAPAAIQPLPEDAQQSAAGYTFTRSEHDHPVFTIRARRSLDLKGGGGTILEGVEVEIYGQAGNQHNRLRTERCEYKPASGDFFCAGTVAMELDAAAGSKLQQGAARPPLPAGRESQPVYLETSALSYNQQKSVASTAARVQWHYGNVAGSGLGLTYSTREGWLELQHEVAATVPVASRGGPGREQLQSPLLLAAARLRYTKGQIELGGPLQINEGARQVAAGHAVTYLDAQNRITRAVLDQGVRAFDPSQNSRLMGEAGMMQADFEPATGNLKEIQANGDARIESNRDSASGGSRLEADHLQASFVGAHFHPAHGTAAGNAHLSSNAVRTKAPSAPAGTAQGTLSGEDLRASRIEFDFRPADGTLSAAHTVGSGKLVLVPASGKVGQREVTAGQFEMAFDGRSRLESVHGLAPTRILFDPPQGAPAGSVPMESRARSLQAQVESGTGALKSVEQSGEFQFFNGDQRANADRADFSADGQVLTLHGKPQLTDPLTRIQADLVVMHLGTNTAEGSGHVSSIRRGDGETTASVHQGSSATPGSATTNVLAERVSADRARGVLHYEGHVRAWQGEHVVESPALDIYRTERRIVAGSPVLTSDLAPANRPSEPMARSGQASPRPLKGGAHAAARPDAVQMATEPAVIHADRLEYFDSENRAAYTGHVRMDASGATLTSDRMDAYFSPGPGGTSTLDHAVADGTVIITEPGRRAAGHHATYEAPAGKMVLTGGPPALYDSEQGYVTGRTLTFFTQGDKVLVDGGDGYRTLSQHGSTK